MKLITLSGLDGSGKSTQIEFLKDYLKSQDKTFFYFHAVEFSVASLEIRPLIFFRGRISKAEKSVMKANWLQIQLRKIALFVDIFRFKHLIKKLSVDYIISDRYFYDSVVNIEYLNRRHRMSRMLAEKYIPKPDFAFYINAKPEIIMQRERKPDQGTEYLIAKEKIFSNKIKDWDMIVVNGKKNKEEIFNKIKLQVWGESS